MKNFSENGHTRVRERAAGASSRWTQRARSRRRAACCAAEGRWTAHRAINRNGDGIGFSLTLRQPLIGAATAYRMVNVVNENYCSPLRRWETVFCGCAEPGIEVAAKVTVPKCCTSTLGNGNRDRAVRVIGDIGFEVYRFCAGSVTVMLGSDKPV